MNAFDNITSTLANQKEPETVTRPHRRKCSIEQCKEIRKRLDANVMGKDIAKEFGVSMMIISNIKNRVRGYNY